ncbi:BnaC01g31440D [Brassica napus]|uniref:BnaC01g31440D protein n=2 Tax=Brassica napus TaxID=3708 RepID=A0A078IBM5_BRANA|nr:BnaC01g31440D [Brassica napus]
MMVLRLQQKLNRTAKKGVLFSIGVSCYLLHLVFTDRVEIHNIVNLRNDVERLLECYNDVLRRKHQEIIKICCNIEKLLEFQVEAELQTEFELLQIGKKQEGNYSKLKVNYLTLKSLIFKRSKIWILCLNSNALGSHITLIFIVFSNGTVFF